MRIRIVRAFAPPRRLTAQALHTMLPDVPIASLYRHLNRLVRGGVLAVVERRPVRGTVEKVYALLAGGTNLTQNDLEEAGKEDHLRYFAAFVGSLIADFSRYLENEHLDFVGDGVGYHQLALYLSDEEFKRMTADVNAVFAPLLALGPAPGRRRRLLSTIAMPGPAAPEDDGDGSAPQ